jgi:hypothetical protein
MREYNWPGFENRNRTCHFSWHSLAQGRIDPNSPALCGFCRENGEVDLTMRTNYSRRDFLGAMGMAAGVYIARPTILSAQHTSASRVAVGVCPEYNRQVVDVLSTMFDQLGGLEGLVRGKTVAIKLNMTSTPKDRLDSMPNEMTHWVHPQVIGALVSLLGKAGAQRVRLLESAPAGTKPLEEFMLAAGWQPRDFASAATRVEFENTNFLGSGKTYARFMVPGGGRR